MSDGSLLFQRYICSTNNASYDTIMIQKITYLIIILTGIVGIACLSSCKKMAVYSFTSPQMALDACNEHYKHLALLESAGIEELAEIICDWHTLQDSAYSVLLNDTAMENADVLTEQFFILSDSVRSNICRLATTQERSLHDILYLKLNTTENRKLIQQSKTYRDAIAFYDKLDQEKVYPNVRTTLKEYLELLRVTEPFKKEQDMLDFIRKEDKCFRSLLMYLTDVPQKELQEITTLTANLFDGLTKVVSYDKTDEVNKRIAMYLSMRFNRRIIQNAMVCRTEILHHVSLTPVQAANFRWMVIQPFFSIDNEAMALLSDAQIEQLEILSKDLVSMFAYIDGKDLSADKKEEQKLNQVLVQYFMKSYLTFTL